MSISNIYCKTIRSNFKKYFGNWEPTETVNLGDIGILENDMFIHKGNIKTFDINNLLIEENIDVGNKTFSTKNSVNIDLKAKSTSNTVSTRAGLEITFLKGNSLFLNAIGCNLKRIEDKISLGNKILDLYKKEKVWDKNWVIITDIIISKNTTVAISETNNSSIFLEAKSDMIEQINLLDTELSFSVLRNNQVGYCIESKNNIIPLMGLCGIKTSFFKQDSFETISSKQYMPSFRRGGKLGVVDTEIIEFGQLE
jgi:hypothetical protein